MKKLSAAIIFFVLSCALLLCACKTRPEYVFNNVDRCEYTLTESGDHVANINKEKYLSSAVAPLFYLACAQLLLRPARLRDICARRREFCFGKLFRHPAPGQHPRAHEFFRLNVAALKIRC